MSFSSFSLSYWDSFSAFDFCLCDMPFPFTLSIPENYISIPGPTVSFKLVAHCCVCPRRIAFFASFPKLSPTPRIHPSKASDAYLFLPDQFTSVRNEFHFFQRNLAVFLRMDSSLAEIHKGLSRISSNTTVQSFTRHCYNIY